MLSVLDAFRFRFRETTPAALIGVLIPKGAPLGEWSDYAGGTVTSGLLGAGPEATSYNFTILLTR